MDSIADNDWELRLSTRSLEFFKIHIWLKLAHTAVQRTTLV